MFGVNFKSIIFLLITVGNTLSILDTEWWKNMIMYEIYMPSFKDSNGDGFGDIAGITNSLDHFGDLGITTVYTSPYCRSPMEDFGYDISNHTDVDPLFGTLEDFDELMREMKKRGLKLIMDMVINHSSDKHLWFKKSIDKIHPYTDYYVWVDPKGFDENYKPIPPNNWLSIFGGRAWEWNEKRGQFYLHQFADKQPDLNLRNNELKKEIKNIFKFWMDRGVDGFRLDATKFYMEDKALRDEPLIKNSKTKTAESYVDLNHTYTNDLWESYQYIHELRLFIDEYSAKKGLKYNKIFVSESYTGLNATMAYYGSEGYDIVHFPFNFKFVELNTYVNAYSFNKLIMEWWKNMPKGATANWMAENHDNIRVGSRFCEEYMDLTTITIMTLPGVACIYYGQEIGMTNSPVRVDQRKDPQNDAFNPISRDSQRLPMQWDDTMNAGFTSSYKPWLPVNPNYWKVNVEAQKTTEKSRYNMFKILSRIKKTKTMKYGQFKSYIVSEWVYAFTRTLKRHEMYITVLNLGSEIEFMNLHDVISNLPPTLEVAIASMNAGYVKGDRIWSMPKFPKIFVMRPYSGIVLTSKIQKPFSDLGSELIDPRTNSS